MNASTKALSDKAADHLSHQLYEIAFRARAARSLLHEVPDTESNDDLTGVSYLLTKIGDDCRRLVEEMDADRSRAGMSADVAQPVIEPWPATKSPAPAGAAICDDRRSLAVKAAWEIEEAIDLLDSKIDFGVEGHRPLRAVLRRVKHLACVQMSALDDGLDTVDEIRKRFEEA